MPLTPHDDYYHKVRQKAHDKMARVTGREAEGDDELRCSLAYALKHGTAEEGMVDVDKLDTFSKAAFKAQPRVDTPFSISFEQADADAFIARLRR